MDVSQLQVLKISFACVNAKDIFIKHYLKGWFDFIFLYLTFFCLVEFKGYTIVPFHIA